MRKIKNELDAERKEVFESFEGSIKYGIYNCFMNVSMCMIINNTKNETNYTLKLSPQPHSPLELGLVKVNSEATSVSMKSISVPTMKNTALGSTNT